MRTEEHAGESDVCMCGKRRVRWSKEGKSSNLGRRRRSPWPHPPSIVKLTKCGPGERPWASNWNPELASSQHPGYKEHRAGEELEEADLGGVTEITLGVAGWGAEEKDALEIQRP